MNANKSLPVLAAAIAMAVSIPAQAGTDRPVRNDHRRMQHDSSQESPRYALAPWQRRGGIGHSVEVRRTVVIERPVVREVVVSRPVYVERPVIVHQPVVREVVIERPVYVERPRVVYQDAPAYPDYDSPYPVANNERSSWLGTLGGALIGAVIGSQVAGPEHRTAAAVAGAAIGGVIGGNF